MSPSMSQSSLPVFEIGLNALSGVLDKAEAFAAAKKLELLGAGVLALGPGHVRARATDPDRY